MTIQQGANLYTQGFGSRPEDVEIPHIDTRAPATTDVKFPIGKLWIDKTNNAAYELTSLTSSGGTVTATWVGTGGGSVALSSLTGDTGTATPSSGNIKIAGTANQITTAASGSTVTLSLPAAITAPGSLTTTTSLSATTTVTAGTGITATTGNITATNGNLVLGTAGNKLSITEGANASLGQATLTGGTVTVSTTAVTANSRIFISRASIGATGAAATGNLVVGTVTAGTSFVINSVQAADATALQASDVSVINWLIIN